jgi:hypothetical protein
MLCSTHNVLFKIRVLSMRNHSSDLYTVGPICISSNISARLGPVICKKTFKAMSYLIRIALGYVLDNRGSGVRFPAILEISLHHRVQNGSGAHPASCPMDAKGSFPGGEAARP